MVRHLIAVFLLVTAGAAQDSRRSQFDASAWTPLFDGATLDGWVTKGGRYDGNAAWSVEDRVICGREGPEHAGGLLYTAKKYACFIISLDVWMTRPNDSGIFVRMAPDGRGAQVTLDDREDGEVGAVYSDEFLSHNTRARKNWKPSEWNRVEVRVTGVDMRIEAWINGEKVSDHQVLAGSTGFATTGLIGLQVHGNRADPPGTIVKFRNIRILELPVFRTEDFTCDEEGVMTPTEAGAKRGWKPLWAAETQPSSGDLRSSEDFENFQIQADFRFGRPGANSGIFLRAARDDSNAAFSGCEIQILDDLNWERLNKKKLERWQHCGSIYGSAAPRASGNLSATGWNTYRIRYQGPSLRVELNNVVVQDVDVTGLEVPKGEKKFAERVKRGFIGLQRHDADPGAVVFRNVFVLPLP
jgi:hypothetical protein